MSNKSDGGKGSSPRPFSVSQAEYDARWDAIFGRDLKEEDTTEEENDEVSSFVSDEEDSLQCLRCGGVDTMYVTQVGFHSVCDQCGYRERLEPDYD